ncbi:uncharacterized protein LOC109832011 isoform X2 [Asparagus officinalis]|uniref:uncharacterized protein LOC109832011 isoform X2 n=1 Tax=Asparagus officinalis TaxID=4686 RepID=UPI00098E354E|nr:uncharacterized protein LOC109832011 isoform X2 [Asparagus officinalis]
MAHLELSDDVLLTIVPIIAYWLFSGLYEILGRFDRYRLHPKVEEDEKNIVSRGTVLKGMIRQQAIQIAVVVLTQREGDDDSFPRELDVLVKKKFLFKIQVSEFNLNQNWPVFSVSKMTDDENLIAAFRDSLDLNQESIGQEYFTDEAESSKKKVDLDNVSLSVTCDNEVEICSSDNITPCKRNLLESDLEHSVSMDLISPQLSSNKKQKQIKIEKEN